MSTGIPFFRKIQSEFDLNGPTLSMQRQPVGTSCSVASGIATFIGIGTAIGAAIFAATNDPTWLAVGVALGAAFSWRAKN